MAAADPLRAAVGTIALEHGFNHLGAKASTLQRKLILYRGSISAVQT